jgi:hypothetical protein
LLIAFSILIVVFLLGWIYFSRKSKHIVSTDNFVQASDEDPMNEPVIHYSLFLLDTRQNRRIEMQAPKEFPNQFGLLSGQSFEMHWNVLNADWISIEGAGFVQAIGIKECHPAENTKYKITAKNRNHTAEQEFFVRVFPVPVMEKYFVPMPEISTNTISLFKTQIPVIQKPDVIKFPSLQIPGIIQIQRDHTAVKPVRIPLDAVPNKVRVNSAGTFKSKIFDKLEDLFKDNYKIKDIIKTIRKHYDY